MAKYQPLQRYLASQHQHRAEIPMTFAEIEQVLGCPLPASASAHRPWWANETHGHVQAKAWLAAGYETANVDTEGRTLVFRRVASGFADEGRAFQHDEPVGEKKPYRHPLFGAMKGTFELIPPDPNEPPPEDPDSWEALALAKFDRLLFGKGE